MTEPVTDRPSLLCERNDLCRLSDVSFVQYVLYPTCFSPCSANFDQRALTMEAISIHTTWFIGHPTMSVWFKCWVCFMLCDREHVFHRKKYINDFLMLAYTWGDLYTCKPSKRKWCQWEQKELVFFLKKNNKTLVRSKKHILSYEQDYNAYIEYVYKQMESSIKKHSHI